MNGAQEKIMAFVGGYEGNTANAYTEDLNTWRLFAQTENIDPLNAEEKDVVLYIHHMRNVAKFSPSSVARKLAALKSFFNWLIQFGHSKKSPFENLKLASNDFIAEAKQIRQGKKEQFRHAAGLQENKQTRALLMFVSNPLISKMDAFRLKLEDLNLDVGQVIVRRRKGDSYIDIDKATVAALKDWIAERSTHPKVRHVFTGSYGNKMAYFVLQKTINDIITELF